MTRLLLGPSILCLCALLSVNGCSHTSPEPTSEPAAGPSMTAPAPSSQPKKFWLDAFSAGFNAKDAASIASLYTPQATWTMSSGASMSQPQIGPGLSKAFGAGAQGFRATDVTRTTVGSAELVRHKYTFEMGGKTLSGERYVLTKDGAVERDIWLPASSPTPAQQAQAASATAAHDAFFNAPNVQASEMIYAPDAFVALTSGAMFRGESVSAFSAKAVPTVSAMSTQVKRVIPVGTHHVATRSSFSATVERAGAPTPLSGERLTLWHIDDAGKWRVLSELSWPQ